MHYISTWMTSKMWLTRSIITSGKEFGKFLLGGAAVI